jgi:predicted RNase H-like HicB family nuclease
MHHGKRELGDTRLARQLRGRVRRRRGVGLLRLHPDLPSVVAAGDARAEAERLRREATAEHLALPRQTGRPAPAPSDPTAVAILDVSAAPAETLPST